MKRQSSIILFLALFVFALSAQTKQDKDNYESLMKKTEWWREARFGMFIHFGLYSIPARGEWVKSAEKISDEDYKKYFDEFNPRDFNPREWAKIAKAAGMKYAVLTAKHHEGFALWDSKLSDYKVTNTPFKRDLVKEFLEAFRAEGIKVGLYFSVLDWHHPDYPKYNDPFHPMRGNEKYKNEKTDWENYLKFMHGQVKELVTNYGKLDIMWFDFSYGEMTGDKWKASELIKMVREYQPNIILDNRLQSDGSATARNKPLILGDFHTPEQDVPEGGLNDSSGRPLPWETCMTLNNSWGYNRYDNNWKSPELIIRTLVNCVSKGGNLLLNVGPDPRGNIPDESINILSEVGKWMEKNSYSIYHCTTAKGLTKPEWGFFTQNGKFLYVHYMNPQVGHINLKGLGSQVKKVHLLRDGSEVLVESNWWGGDASKDNFYLNINKPTYMNYAMPDPYDTVYELELK
jgi:alpha-L-fucosidase